MADQTYEVTDNGAEMDYPQHEKTFSMFISLFKWGIILNVILLVSMVVMFYTGAGIIGGILLLIVLVIAAKLLF